MSLDIDTTKKVAPHRCTMDWRCVLSFCLSFAFVKSNSEGSVCSRKERTILGLATVYYCCTNYAIKKEKCEECPNGFTSNSPHDKECKKCQKIFFGNRCSEKCTCGENERCDNVIGCVPAVKSAKSATQNKDDTASETGSSNAVVAYMSIIATFGAVVFIGIAAWRNKEFLQKKLKKQKMRFPRLQRSTDDVSGKEKSEKTTTRKSENLYDDINEKYMIKDFKVFDGK